MNRKAITHALLKGVIMTLVIIGIFFLFLSRTRDIFEAKAMKQICKTDVYGKAGLGIKPFKAIQRAAEFMTIGSHEISSDLNCPTQELLIKESLDTESGQRRAKHEIARAMYDCWDMFGEGTLELFESKTDIEMYCVMCHYITFKDNDNEINGLLDYLKTEAAPTGDMTYYEYLTGFETTPELDGFTESVDNYLRSHNTPEVHTAGAYATTFFYYKKGYFDKIKSTLTGMIGGAGSAATLGMVAIFIPIPGAQVIGVALVSMGTGIGYLAGSSEAADWKSGVMFMPYEAEQLAQLGCTYFPGKQSEKE